MELSILTIVMAISAVASLALGGFRLVPLLPKAFAGDRYAVRWSIFWALVASYGVGKLFETAQSGPDFLRYHLCDIGFIAVWGALVLNSKREPVINQRVKIPTDEPIHFFRAGIIVAFLAGMGWELLTGLYISGREDLAESANMLYTGFDWWDTAMYVIGFMVTWRLSSRLFIVEQQRQRHPSRVKAQAAVGTVSRPRSTPPATNASAPRWANSKRVTPKGTQPRNKAKKRR